MKYVQCANAMIDMNYENPLDTPEMRREIDELYQNTKYPFDFDKWLSRILFGKNAKFFGRIDLKIDL